MKHRGSRLLIFLLNFCFASQILFSQETESYLHVRGLAEENMRPTENAIVRLYKNGKLHQELKTDFSGEFDFKLDVNEQYQIEVTKDGYISKKLAFLTGVPENEAGVWVNDFAISLVRECPGVDVSVLKRPMDEIKYDARSRSFKPDKDYSRKMFKELEQIYYNLNECQLALYKTTIDRAEELYKSDRLEEARDEFRKAADQMPQEPYPKKRIYDIVQELQRRYAQEGKYIEIVNIADALFNDKKYNDAREQYQAALNVKPNDAYALSRIEQTKQLIVESTGNKQDQKTEAQNIIVAQGEPYEAILDKADALYNNKQYSEAKAEYKKAMALQPNDPYPSSRIKKLDKLLEKQQLALEEETQYEIQENYNNALRKADNLFAAKQYGQAKTAYQQALTIKPGESYPTSKMREIEVIESNKILHEQRLAEKENKYKELIDNADNLLVLKEYSLAKQKYEEALALKPGDTYPTSKIAVINNLLNREKQQQEQQHLKEQQYEQLIAEGNKLFQVKRYNEALTQFQRALNLKPGDTFAAQRIADINGLQQQQENLEKQYANLITQAENLMEFGEYEGAKTKFTQASNLKNNEQYPKTKIGEIDQLLAQKAADETAKIEEEKKFNQALLQANNLVQMEEYDLAKTELNKALQIKPGNSYALQKIGEINKIIDEKKRAEQLAFQKEVDYKKLLNSGEQLLTQQKYQEALIEFNQARNLKPEEALPLQKIAFIKGKLQLIADEENKAVELRQKYQESISKADKLLDNGDHTNAKQQYELALNYVPESVYAKEQIRKIDRITALLKEQQSSSGASSGGALTELKFNNDTERQVYLNKLKRSYPEGITLEIYKASNVTTKRYVIVRNNEANEFREVRYSWGGIDYTMNDKPVTQIYFNSQTRKREGEYYKEFNK